MNWCRNCWWLIKMFYKLLWCSASLISLFFNIFWFVCNLASAGIPWFTLILLIICIVSKFVKLRSPNEKTLLNLLGSAAVSNGAANAAFAINSTDELSFWPIANRAAGYDAPENSKAALKKCAARGYRNVLVDAGLTSCGEIAIVNRSTLERAGLTGGIAQHTLEELRTINLSDLHPLGSQFPAEHVYTLKELMEFVRQTQLTVFLHISDNGALMLEKLKLFIKEHDEFLTRTILVSRSPIVIYQLRKLYPELICGLWTDKTLSLAVLKASTLTTSVFGAIFRNIIAPVIGISIVFVSKEEFNLHVAELWRNVGVRPIVYNVNSPNEKRYFQKTMKTQYLTDSLRSEPHLLMKA